MFLYPIFWGCKYTKLFLFINNIIVFQHIILLITSCTPPLFTLRTALFAQATLLEFHMGKISRHNTRDT
jgi:hypothetical protein